MRRHPSTRGRVGLALAGGGPMGAMYELGALRALEESVDGLNVNDAWSYVGVSAGSFIAACLANGVTMREMLASVLRGSQAPFPLRPELFFTPAYGELLSRGAKVPRLALSAALSLVRPSGSRSVGEAISILSHALPAGVFNNDPVREYLARVFSTEGRTDDFRALKRPLVVVAADLETGTTLRFGEEGLDDVPISRAVQASTAVPGVYPPVRIGGRDCVDGMLLKTVHASVALEHGAKLLFCINPLVPVDVTAVAEDGRVPDDILVQLGLPSILSQAFRTMIRSRLEAGIARYGARFPDADVVLLEPRTDDYAMFFANIFSFRSRVAICECGYAATRRDLRARFDELAPRIASHGFTLRADVLLDDTRDLWDGLGLTPTDGDGETSVERLDRVLTDLEAAVGAGARRGAKRTFPAARARRRR